MQDLYTGATSEQFFVISTSYFPLRFWPYRRDRHLIRVSIPHFIHITLPAAELWHLIHFQHGSGGGAILLPVLYLPTSLSSESRNLSANQNPLISIYVWDITTSGLEKRTSAILEFYFQFRFRPYRGTRNFNLHQAATLHPNATILRLNGDMIFYRFSKWRPLWHNFDSGFRLGDVALFRTRSSLLKNSDARISAISFASCSLWNPILQECVAR